MRIKLCHNVITNMTRSFMDIGNYPRPGTEDAGGEHDWLSRLSKTTTPLRIDIMPEPVRKAVDVPVFVVSVAGGQSPPFNRPARSRRPGTHHLEMPTALRISDNPSSARLIAKTAKSTETGQSGLSSFPDAEVRWHQGYR
jgi:hypothetical protein